MCLSLCLLTDRLRRFVGGLPCCIVQRDKPKSYQTNEPVQVQVHRASRKLDFCNDYFKAIDTFDLLHIRTSLREGVVNIYAETEQICAAKASAISTVANCSREPKKK